MLIVAAVIIVNKTIVIDVAGAVSSDVDVAVIVADIIAIISNRIADCT